MVNYSNCEYTDMVLVYIESTYNSRAAVRLYAARYPDRQQRPNSNTVQEAFRRFSETGSVARDYRNCGAPRIARTVRNEERILAAFGRDPTLSIREVARMMQLSCSTIQRTLKTEKMHAYHYTRVHRLQAEDFPARLEFCRWILRRHEDDHNFLGNVLFTNESTFGRDSTWIYHNYHYWEDVNPNVTTERNFQHRFSINLWAGIIDGRLVSTYK